MHPQSTRRRPLPAPVKPTIRRLGRARYEIGSRTTTGVTYVVELLSNDAYRCSCPARHGCWHGPFAWAASRLYAAFYAAHRVDDLPSDLPPFPECPALAPVIDLDAARTARGQAPSWHWSHMPGLGGTAASTPGGAA